jgi:hypothetical protein
MEGEPPLFENAAMDDLEPGMAGPQPNQPQPQPDRRRKKESAIKKIFGWIFE